MQRFLPMVCLVCFLNGVYRRANVLDEFNFFFFFPYMDSTFGIKKSLPNLGLHRFSLLEHAQQTQPADHI